MVSMHTLTYVEYEERNGIGVWTVTDFASHFNSEKEVERGEKHYRERASSDDMSATVVAIENAEELGTEMRDTLDHINEEWSELADDVDIDRLAYVADGIMASTVRRQIDAAVETDSFSSVDDAVEWCRNA
jgi:hypothetical protein